MWTYLLNIIYVKDNLFVKIEHDITNNKSEFQIHKKNKTLRERKDTKGRE